jgi:hypothetical protein
METLSRIFVYSYTYTIQFGGGSGNQHQSLSGPTRLASDYPIPPSGACREELSQTDQICSDKGTQPLASAPAKKPWQMDSNVGIV